MSKLDYRNVEAMGDFQIKQALGLIQGEERRLATLRNRLMAEQIRRDRGAS